MSSRPLRQAGSSCAPAAETRRLPVHLLLTKAAPVPERADDGGALQPLSAEATGAAAPCSTHAAAARSSAVFSHDAREEAEVEAVCEAQRCQDEQRWC